MMVRASSSANGPRNQNTINNNNNNNNNNRHPSVKGRIAKV